MAITDIAKSRACGQIRFHAIFDNPVELNEILEDFCLNPVADKLLEIDLERAVRVLVRWLCFDMAYGTKLMNADTAQTLAREFLRDFVDETSRFFTNGHWHDSEQPRTWTSMTETVFVEVCLSSREKGMTHGTFVFGLKTQIESWSPFGNLIVLCFATRERQRRVVNVPPKIRGWRKTCGTLISRLFPAAKARRESSSMHATTAL